MGGYGSSRWGYHIKKNTVEDCLQLSVASLKRDQVLQNNFRKLGSWHWVSTFTKKKRASISYEINTYDVAGWLRLYYTTTDFWGEKTDLDYRVQLQTSPCNFGGVRWWFVCPLSLGGQVCGRKVAKLFKPPNSNYFGCRECHDLTYQSSQESSKRLRPLKKLDPFAVMQLLKNGSIDVIDALQVLPDEIWRH